LSPPESIRRRGSCAAAPIRAASARSSSGELLNIPFTQHRLDNGLDVIVHEDHGCPIVAVNLWYHVGSKNEKPGRTGFAHLFEHLMFEGSQHHDRGYFQPLQQAGASLNGSTNADRTNYWEVVPTNALELALWMESDRMGYLLPALTDAKFDNQRDVVLNERRQNYENRPYGLASMATLSALYAPDHPYHWLTIGVPDDLRAAHLDDVRAFFQTYYRPRNASLALAGDIDTDRALALADHYFGEIESGDDPPPVEYTPATMPHGDVRLVLEDRVELPRIYIAWHSPALFAADDAELDLVAELMAGGKTSRLYRTLVFEERIATEVAASQNSREIGGFFQIVATAAPGRTLAELERAITRELSAVAADGPTTLEMERCLAQAESHFVFRLQTVGGFGGKSDQLNAYNVFLDDAGFFDRDLARYRAVTSDGIRRVTSAWLPPRARVLLSVVPRGRVALGLPDSAAVAVS
jgi:zinc protease